MVCFVCLLVMGEKQCSPIPVETLHPTHQIVKADGTNGWMETIATQLQSITFSTLCGNQG